MSTSSERMSQMSEILKGREPITPDDLPPFGAHVTTHQGYTGEILGWYSPAGNSNRVERQRLALAMVIETPGASVVLPEGKTMFLGYVLEEWIARNEPQRFPRFAKWIREVAVSSAIGRQWRED